MPLPNLNNPVKKAIKSQGRTFTWLSKKTGISQPQLSRKLDGLAPLSQDEAERIADLTGIPVQVFPVRGDRRRRDVREAEART